MAVSARRLNRQARGAVDRAMLYEQQLADLYAGQLRRAAAHAARKFRQRSSVSFSAAANPQQPDWVPPDVDELMTEPLDEQAAERARRIHLKALLAAAPPAVVAIADDLGISFDVTSPFVTALLNRVGERIVSLTQETRDVIQKVMAQAYGDGWSVTETAAALREQVAHLSTTTALMQARTDLVGLANGASLASAQALGEAAPPTKIWLTAGDERVRDTHAEADGQEVPIDQPFQVGDDLLMYPGDPDGSDGETCNCRCVLIYGDGAGAAEDLTASAVQGSDLLEGGDLTRQSAGVVVVPGAHRHGENDVRLRSLGDEVRPEQLDRLARLQRDGLVSVHRVPILRDDAALVGLRLVDESESEDLSTALDQSEVGVHKEQARLVADGRVLPESSDGYRSLAVDESGEVSELLVSSHSSHTSSAPAGSSVRPVEHLPSPEMGTQAPSPEATDEVIELGPGDRLLVAPAGDGLTASVTVVTVDDSDEEQENAAAAAQVVRWRGILCVEGEDSQDGPSLIRTLAEGGGSWRTPPLPLGAMFETPHAYEVPAPIAGGIDRIWRNPDNMREIWGEGWLNADEVGGKAAELVGNGSLRGISIDPYVAEMDVIEPDGAADQPEVMAESDGETVTTIQPTRMIFKRYVIGGATLCPFQALENAQVAIVAAAGRPNDEPRVLTDGRVELVDPNEEAPVEDDTLTAAASPLPPREWFETQEPPGPMPLTVTDDGRVFGHLALWDSCHTGFANECVRPPRSRSGYAYFHVGEIETSDGSAVSVGKLMIGKADRPGKHASISASRLEAQRHYDDNTAVGAYIRVVDGRYGPWAAGCVRPGLDDGQLAQLRANPPSGDWRKVNGSLEMIAALSVPVPGFPTPRAEVALVASGQVEEVAALIASSGEVAASELALMALEREGLLPSSRPRVARPVA